MRWHDDMYRLKNMYFIEVYKTGSRLSLLNSGTKCILVLESCQESGGIRTTYSLPHADHKNEYIFRMGLDWDEYFKFGFVRNPWDRELSNYFFNGGKLKPPEDISFKEWLNMNLRKDGLIHDHNTPQCDYLTDVDYIARFENYAEES